MKFKLVINYLFLNYLIFIGKKKDKSNELKESYKNFSIFCLLFLKYFPSNFMRIEYK